MTKEFSWRYTQFSQFNKSDTLLLVSGVHHGNMTTSGEIAVFDLEGKNSAVSCFRTDLEGKNSSVSCFRTEVLTTVLQKGLFEVTFFVASFPSPRLSIIKTNHFICSEVSHHHFGMEIQHALNTQQFLFVFVIDF